jgi:cytochrome c
VKFKSIIPIFAAAVVLIATSTAVVAGDATKGKKIAKKCTACHTLNKGGKNRLGPNLYGIINKPAASVKGYRYSKAMKSAKIVWNEAAFTEFVTKPKKFIKRTKMSFAGIKNAEQRRDLIAYFRTLTDASQVQESHGDPVAGKIVAINQCTVCHTFKKGGKMLFGPNLFGSYGKPSGQIKGYAYSKALKKARLVWTEANLIEFLADPEKFLPGTKAKFPGVKNAKQRADVVAYLRTFQ